MTVRGPTAFNAPVTSNVNVANVGAVNTPRHAARGLENENLCW